MSKKDILSALVKAPAKKNMWQERKPRKMRLLS